MKKVHELCATLSTKRRWTILRILHGYPHTIDTVCQRLGMEAGRNTADRQAVRRDLEALAGVGLVERVPDEIPVVYIFSLESYGDMIKAFVRLGEEGRDEH